MLNSQSFAYLILIVLFGLFVWLVVLTFAYYRQKRFFAQFTQGVTKKDLKSLLDNLAKSFKEVGREIDHLNTDVKAIKIDTAFHLQKIGFLRYNPFADTGGDQSFCLCLLDKYNNGIVITSLHSREQTRIYAKVVSHGKAAGYEFAKEELEAVALAIKKGNQAKH